jgi:iron complex outermembrane receptor protein
MKKILTCIMVMIAATAVADSLMQDTYYLDTITVEETAYSGAVNVLDKTDVKVVEKNRSNNIADFIAKDPEISMKRKAAFGDSGDVLSIRGMESKRMLLNLDGRNISSTGNVGGNYIDFGTIPLDSIDRIEIIKGGSSAEYGNSALGGVVNAYTAHPSGKPSLSLYGTLGGWDNADDFHNIRGSYGQQFGAVGISLGVSHQQAEEYLLNNDYESFHIAPKIYIQTPWDGGEFVFGYNYTKTRRGLIRSNRADGVPGSDSDPTLAGFNTKIYGDYPLSSGETFAGGTPTPSMAVIGDGAYWKKVRQLLDVKFSQFIGDDIYIEASAYKNIEDRREKNYADIESRLIAQTSAPDTFDPALTSDGDLVLDRDIEVDRSYGFKLKTEITKGRHLIVAGAEQKHLKSGGIDVRYVDTNYNKAVQNGWTGNMSGSGGNDAQSDGFFVSDIFNVTDRLSLNFGARYDRFDSDIENADFADSAVTPKLGATYSITPSDKVSVFVYQNYRTPTLPEVYWNSQSNAGQIAYLEGALKPEKANAVDAAYRHSFSRNEFVQLSAYYYDVDDYIIHKAVPVSLSSKKTQFAAYNTQAKFLGVTLTAAHDIAKSLSGSFGATYQKTEKEDDPADPNGNLDRMDYIPDYKAQAGLSWKMTEKTWLDVGAVYVGEREYAINAADVAKLDSYTIFDASLKHKLTEKLTLELYADNITNTDYEESWGFPALGFNMGVSVKWML